MNKKECKKVSQQISRFELSDKSKIRRYYIFRKKKERHGYLLLKGILTKMTYWNENVESTKAAPINVKKGVYIIFFCDSGIFIT